MLIPEPDSNSRSASPGARRWLLASCQLLLLVVCAGLTGCSSIYQRTWAKLPPQPGDELSMRMDEAQAVERVARQAGEKLRADLKQGVSEEILQAGFDRLEMLARELQRRLSVVRDFTAKTVTGASMIAECERLEQCARLWLLYVESTRHADVAIQAAQLDGVLLNVDEGSASSDR